MAGGFEIALACDLIVAARNASFGLPEVRIGLIAGSGGLIRLPQRIPPQIAMEYALTGRVMPAEEAARWGLVNRLSEPGEALEAALAIAREIAANAPLSVRISKQVIKESPGWPTEEVWARQNELLEQVIESEDAREGALAFSEKRAPQWRGR